MSQSDKRQPTSKSVVSAQPTPSESGEETESGSTPMLAVWLTLAAIVLAGLYGLMIGNRALNKPKTEPGKTSFQQWSSESVASRAARRFS